MSCERMTGPPTLSCVVRPMVEEIHQCHGLGAGEREATTRLSGCVMGLSTAAPVRRELAIPRALEVRVTRAKGPVSPRGSR